MSQVQNLPVRFHNLGEKAPSDRMPFFIGQATLKHPVEYSHIHYGLEIGAVKAGKGELHLAGRSHPMKAGDVYFLNGMHPHAHGAAEGGTMDNLYVHLKQESVILVPPPKNDLRLYEPFWYPPGVLPPVVKAPNPIHGHLLKAFEESQSISTLADIRAWVSILSALVALAETIEPQIQDSHTKSKYLQRDTIMAALKFIHGHFTEPLSVEGIASHCNMSESHFSHLFTGVMHIAPVEYRNKLRITRACERLATTQDKISTIALECGFNSLSQFNDLFRRTTGVSPNDLRKKG